MLNRRAGTYLMRLLPIRVYGRIVPRDVIGLCYHLVSDRRVPHVQHLYPYKSVAQFDADLRYLKRNFRVLSYPELVEARESGRSDPNAVHLSFDDGYAECFSVVRPLLHEHGLPCTFFVNTGVLDNRRMLDLNRVSLCVGALRRLPVPAAAEVLRGLEAQAGRPLPDVTAFAAWIRPLVRDPDSGASGVLDRLCPRLGVDVEAYLASERPYLAVEEVRKLAAEGFTVGAHTHMHTHLGSLSRPERVEEEIAWSCRMVAEITGARRVPFAFPYDADGVDRGLLREMLEAHRFVGHLFGTGKLRRDREFMVNRMVADWPPSVGTARSNLPGQLCGAYLEEVMRWRGGGVAARTVLPLCGV